MRLIRFPSIRNRYVLLAFFVQILSFISFLAVATSDPGSPIIELAQGLPGGLLAILSIFSLPAVGVTVAIGLFFQYVFGWQMNQMNSIILTRGDAPFFIVAYLLSVSAVKLVKRVY